MIPLESVQSIPTLHWLLLAGAGWLLMFACFVGWHLERRRPRPRIQVAPEPTTENVRRAA